jgi:hypothetical protein
MALAETVARAWRCLGVHVNALSFQAAWFHEKMGYSMFGALEDGSPGHQRRSSRKPLT